MFGKVIGGPNKKTDCVKDVGVGVLFRVVESQYEKQVGLICIKIYNSEIVTIIGCVTYPAFLTTWDQDEWVVENWKVEILTTEQVIISNEEIK